MIISFSNLFYHMESFDYGCSVNLQIQFSAYINLLLRRHKLRKSPVQTLLPHPMRLVYMHEESPAVLANYVVLASQAYACSCRKYMP